MNKRLILVMVLIAALIVPGMSQALYVRYAKPLFIANTLDKRVPPITGADCPGNTASWIFANSLNIAVSPWPENINQNIKGLRTLMWSYKSSNPNVNNQGQSCTQPIGVNFTTLKGADNLWAATDAVSTQPQLEYMAAGQTVFYYSTNLSQWGNVTYNKQTYYFIGCENDTSDNQNRFIRCCFELDKNSTTCTS